MEEEMFDLEAVRKAMEVEIDQKDARILERRNTAAAAGWVTLTQLVGTKSDVPLPARVEAARVLVTDHELIVTEVMGKKLPQVEDEDAWIVEELLREAAHRLLASDEDDLEDADIGEGLDSGDPFKAMVWARVAKYVATRSSLPQDLGEPAGNSMRTAMLQICEEAERLAWAASGGLL
jgi:hypothetical protein